MNHVVRMAAQFATGVALSVSCLSHAQSAAPSGEGSPTTASAEAKSGDAQSVTRRIKGTRVAMTMPASWKRLRVGAGYGDKRSGLEFYVAEIDVPYAAVLARLQPGGEVLKGYTFESRQEVRIEGRDGVLVRGTGTRNDVNERRYWLAFGNAANTVVVTLWHPMENNAQLSDLVQEVLLSTTWNTRNGINGIERLPFTFDLPQRLRFAAVVGENVTFTPSGRLAMTGPTQPILRALVIKKELTEVTVEGARKQFERVGGGNPIKILSFSPITVGSVSGFEGTAEMSITHRGSPHTLTVYLAQLFDGEYQYNLFGQAGVEEIRDFLPELRAATRSVKILDDAQLQTD